MRCAAREGRESDPLTYVAGWGTVVTEEKEKELLEARGRWGEVVTPLRLALEVLANVVGNEADAEEEVSCLL